MSLDSENFIPKLSNWFSSNVEYEGQGIAEFSDPRLTVEGYVKIQYDEFGNEIVVMDAEKVDTELSPDIPSIPLEFRIPMLMALLSGDLPVERPVKGTDKVTKWSWPLSGKKSNPCKKLKVVTPNAVFKANNNIYYDIKTDFTRGNGFRVQLSFNILSSVFDVDNSFEAKYWVLPLSNFVSKFMESCSELDHHPLRIYPTPIIPDSLSKKDAEKASIESNERNHLIIFQYLNQIGFIEPLPDYEERKQKLLEGRMQSVITSIMVGNVAPNSLDPYGLKEWFPYQFLDLLGLSTGTEVGSPWIEFRDAWGKLVRRIHISLNRPWFSNGHVTIDESLHRGTGSLLTQSQFSLHIGNPYLTAVLKHIIRGGMNELLFEDRMTHLFQAIDCLCEVFGLSVQNLTQNLEPSQKFFVKQTLATAAKNIRSQGDVISDFDQRNALSKIAQRLVNADNADRDFGLAVVDLINLFDLPDASIVDNYYKINPRKDKRGWCEVLSHYRGVTMHSSYFDFERGKYDFQEVAAIKAHLHDILIRIVLKMLCYDGTYQKAIPDLTGRYSLNWVKPNTSAVDLGYK